MDITASKENLGAHHGGANASISCNRQIMRFVSNDVCDLILKSRNLQNPVLAQFGAAWVRYHAQVVPAAV